MTYCSWGHTLYHFVSITPLLVSCVFWELKVETPTCIPAIYSDFSVFLHTYDSYHIVVFTELDLSSSVLIPLSIKTSLCTVQVYCVSHRWLNPGFYSECVCCHSLPVLRTLQQLHPNQHWQWLLALDYGGTLAWSHLFTVIFPLINLPLCLSLSSLLLYVYFSSSLRIRKPRPVSQLVSQQQVTQQFVLPSQPKKEKKERAEREKSDREPALKKNSHKKMR